MSAAANFDQRFQIEAFILADYPYVQIVRRFLEIGTSDPDDDPNAAMLLAVRNKKHGLAWEGVLKFDAAIILGAAGAGKTREVLNQALQLRTSGTAAFVVRLEALGRHPLQQSFSPDDNGGQSSFTNWQKKGGDAVAFLDALDEARLPQAIDTSALADALSCLSSGVGRRGATLKLVITTRGSEWQGASDLALVKSALQRLRQATSENAEDQNRPPQARVFRLSQLDAGDISAIAKSRNVDANQFIDAVNKSLSADLMRQPLEVHFLLDLWLEQIANSRPPQEAFSSRLEVFDRIVLARLRTEHGQVRRSNIDPISARHACERLAAVAVISGVRDMSVTPIAQSISALDALATDTDRWTEVEVRQLLSSALFHPSVGGRIRFAHRQIQDYLAAGFFKRAIERNAGSLDVVSPLVAHGLGAPQIPSSTEHVLGWLGTLSPSAKTFVTRLKPALLIETGDPRSLSTDEREKALRAQVALYKDRRFRGEFFYHNDLARFATPSLASVVRELLSQTSSPEVRIFLVEIARFGRMTELASTLTALIVDATEPLRARAEACFALDEFDNRTYAGQVLQAALLCPQPDPDDTDNASTWNMFQLAALTYAYPAGVTILDVITIIARLIREATNHSSTTPDLLVNLIGKLDDRSRPDWLNIFLQFARRGRDPSNDEMPRLLRRYHLLAPAIAQILLDLLREEGDRSHTDVLLDGLEYLFRFRTERSLTTYRMPFEELAANLLPRVELKEALVWRRIALFDPSLPEPRVVRQAIVPVGFEDHHGMAPVFTDEDVRNFCERMRKALLPRECRLAFEVAWNILVKLVDVAQRRRALAEITSAARRYGDAELRRSFGVVFPRFRRLGFQFRHDYQYRLRRWLRNVPESLTAVVWHARNMLTFIRWHRAIQDASNISLLVWAVQMSPDNGIMACEELRNRYGRIVAGWFRSGFVSYWRRYPISYSDRNTYGAIVGLAGLALEADNGLSPMGREDVAKAFGYAFCNLNGFPDWLPPLAAAHQDGFIAVCSSCIREEFRNGDPERRFPSDAVSKVAYSNVAIRAAVSPLFLAELQGTVPANEADLELATQIVAKSTSVDRVGTRDLLRSGFDNAAAAFDFKLAWIWLEALFEADANAAWDAIETYFGDDWRAAAASVFLSFLGRDRLLFSRAEEIKEERDDLSSNCTILARMVRLSYLVWPPERDPRHESVYSPGLEDRAAERRRSYLERLARNCSQEALDALDMLASDHRLAEFRDGFLYERDQVIRNSARRPIFTIDQTIKLLNGISKRPTTVTEFRDLVRRHLNGLLDRLRNSDDDESYIFRRGAGTEDDLRNWLSARLREVGDHYYTVVREQEVAGEKRPDLRIHSRDAGLGSASIEIKMADADHWSGDLLIEKIKTQLAELYLLEQGSHTGFYLLTNGAKPREPELGKGGDIKRNAFRKRVGAQWVTFDELIEFAKARAADVTMTLPNDKVVEIVAVDLSEK